MEKPTKLEVSGNYPIYHLEMNPHITAAVLAELNQSMIEFLDDMATPVVVISYPSDPGVDIDVTIKMLKEAATTGYLKHPKLERLLFTPGAHKGLNFIAAVTRQWLPDKIRVYDWGNAGVAQFRDHLLALGYDEIQIQSILSTLPIFKES